MSSSRRSDVGSASQGAQPYLGEGDRSVGGTTLRTAWGCVNVLPPDPPRVTVLRLGSSSPGLLKTGLPPEAALARARATGIPALYAMGKSSLPRQRAEARQPPARLHRNSRRSLVPPPQQQQRPHLQQQQQSQAAYCQQLRLPLPPVSLQQSQLEASLQARQQQLLQQQPHPQHTPTPFEPVASSAGRPPPPSQLAPDLSKPSPFEPPGPASKPQASPPAVSVAAVSLTTPSPFDVPAPPTPQPTPKQPPERHQPADGQQPGSQQAEVSPLSPESPTSSLITRLTSGVAKPATAALRTAAGLIQPSGLSPRSLLSTLPGAYPPLTAPTNGHPPRQQGNGESLRSMHVLVGPRKPGLAAQPSGRARHPPPRTQRLLRCVCPRGWGGEEGVLSACALTAHSMSAEEQQLMMQSAESWHRMNLEVRGSLSPWSSTPTSHHGSDGSRRGQQFLLQMEDSWQHSTAADRRQAPPAALPAPSAVQEEPRVEEMQMLAAAALGQASAVVNGATAPARPLKPVVSSGRRSGSGAGEAGSAARTGQRWRRWLGCCCGAQPSSRG